MINVGYGGRKVSIAMLRKDEEIYDVDFITPTVVKRPPISIRVSEKRLEDFMKRISAVTEAANSLRKARSLASEEERTVDTKAKQFIRDIEGLGQITYRQIIPLQIREKCKRLKSSCLELGIDEKVIQYPWELMHDGEDFICLKHAIGRYVSSKDFEAPFIDRSTPKERLNFLIIGDPLRGDPRYELPGATIETETLAEELSKIRGVQVKLLISDEADTMTVLNELPKGYDFIHYSGHAHFNAENPDESGLLLSDGLLEAFEITKYLDKPPILAFVNACESSRERSWSSEIAYENQVFGLAGAFLRRGAYYIGSLWPVHDDAAVDVALNFYKSVLNGVPLGESLRQAKVRAFKKNGGKEIAWASYILYGDPTLVLTRSA